MIQSTEDVANNMAFVFSDEFSDETHVTHPVTSKGLGPTVTTFDVYTVEGRTFRVTVSEVRE